MHPRKAIITTVAAHRPQMHGLLGIICKSSPTDVWFHGSGSGLVDMVFSQAVNSRMGYITFSELAATNVFPSLLELVNQQRCIVHQKVPLQPEPVSF